jgi:hypothetical protein
MLNSGNPQAASANTLTLASSADSRDDYYNDQSVMITDGTGEDQIMTISDYVGSTRVATLSTSWSVIPNSNSTYSTLIDSNFPEQFHLLIPMYAVMKAFSKERSLNSKTSFNMTPLKELERDFINTYESRSNSRQYTEPWNIEIN